MQNQPMVLHHSCWAILSADTPRNHTLASTRCSSTTLALSGATCDSPCFGLGGAGAGQC